MKSISGSCRGSSVVLLRCDFRAQDPQRRIFAADQDPTRRQDQFNITQAQTDGVVQPDGMLDELGREAEATMRVRRHGHAAPPDTIRQDAQN